MDTLIAGKDAEHVRESQMRLARVGIENVAGYLADGLAGWIQNGFELDYIPQITVQDFVELQNQDRTGSPYWTYASPEKQVAA